MKKKNDEWKQQLPVTVLSHDRVIAGEVIT